MSQRTQCICMCIHNRLHIISKVYTNKCITFLKFGGNIVFYTPSVRICIPHPEGDDYLFVSPPIIYMYRAF